jgi:PBSX family phage terminase large subunit
VSEQLDDQVQVRIIRASAWQRQAFADKSPVVLFTGGAGGGKSFCAAQKMHQYMKKYPGAFGVMVRKTRDSMTNSTVLFFKHEIVGQDSSVTFSPSNKRFEYDNGSMLVYGGMRDDQQKEQIRSIGKHGGVDIIWMEEANQFSEADYNELSARMRGRATDWRQIILTTNPDADTHWINRRLIQGKGARTYISFVKDNPINPEDYLERLDTLTGIDYDRMVRGIWKRAEGAVYDMFDRSVHIVDWFNPPAEWRRYRAIDFGFTNPFCCQWWARDPDDNMYLYREIYHSNINIVDHGKRINELSQDESYEITVADHDSGDRDILSNHFDIATVAAKKDIPTGLQVVKNRLRINPQSDKPRLFIMAGALDRTDGALENAYKPTCTEEEFSGYTWVKGLDGKPVPEVPVDKNNHGMDAMRYLLMYLFGASEGAQVIKPSDIYEDMDSGLRERLEVVSF